MPRHVIVHLGRAGFGCARCNAVIQGGVIGNSLPYLRSLPCGPESAGTHTLDNSTGTLASFREAPTGRHEPIEPPPPIYIDSEGQRVFSETGQVVPEYALPLYRAGD